MVEQEEAAVAAAEKEGAAGGEAGRWKGSLHLLERGRQLGQRHALLGRHAQQLLRQRLWSQGRGGKVGSGSDAR